MMPIREEIYFDKSKERLFYGEKAQTGVLSCCDITEIGGGAALMS